MLTLNQAQQFNRAYKQNPTQYNNYCRTDINGRVAGSIGEYLKQNQKAMKSLVYTKILKHHSLERQM